MVPNPSGFFLLAGENGRLGLWRQVFERCELRAVRQGPVEIVDRNAEFLGKPKQIQYVDVRLPASNDIGDIALIATSDDSGFSNFHFKEGEPIPEIDFRLSGISMPAHATL